jgi:aminoglycoside phosphotransferase (APT) family kinase protein
MTLTEQLQDFIAKQLSEAQDLVVSNLARMSGGASRETWTFDVAWRENGERIESACVLRRDPPLSLLEAGLTTDRSFEFRTVRALEDLPIPLPRMYWLDAEGKALGRPSLIMERMAGQPSPPAFPPGMEAAFRDRIAGQFIDILAHVHQVDWRARGLDFLGVPGPGRDAALRQVRLWKDVYDRRRPEPLPVIAAALGWLEANAPEADRITLVHGDFRTGNFLFEDPPSITAMLDWELAHLGDPMEDVGWASMKFWSGAGLGRTDRAGGVLPALRGSLGDPGGPHPGVLLPGSRQREDGRDRPVGRARLRRGRGPAARPRGLPRAAAVRGHRRSAQPVAP